jgi:hypothetical protein
MIPPERVNRALLNIEKREVLDDITQLKAAILHLLTEGKKNYDAAKNSNDRQEDYGETSDQIMEDLEARLEERNERLDSLNSELASLSDE